MKFHRKFLLIGITVLFLIYLVWDFFLFLSTEKTTQWHYWFNATMGSFYIFGGLLGVTQGLSFGLKSNLGKMLFFFSLGIFSFATGTFTWLYYNLNLNVEAPYPSWADAGYFPSYFLMAISVFFLVKIYRPLVGKKLIIGSVIAGLLSLVVIFGFISKPDISPDIPFLQRVFNVYYPTADVVSTIMAFIALMLGRGKLNKGLYILSLGFLIQVSADLTFNYLIKADKYWNGGFSDLLFMCAAYLFCISLVEIINSMQQAAVTTEKSHEIQ